MMDDEMKQAIRATFADGRRQLGQALRAERERAEAFDRIREVPVDLQGHAKLDAEVSKWLSDKQLHLRLVLILTALDSSEGVATIEGLVQSLEPTGGHEEMMALVVELVRRRKVVFDGEFVRRAR